MAVPSEFTGTVGDRVTLRIVQELHSLVLPSASAGIQALQAASRAHVLTTPVQLLSELVLIEVQISVIIKVY